MSDLLAPDFINRLRKLNLVLKHKFPGSRVGSRKTRRKGSSLEFKDYKEYTPGDDTRFIDWNVWGRLDALFVKLFYHEENQNLFFLLDTSRSMNFGSPLKWNFVQEVTAALAYIALGQKDLVQIGSLNKTEKSLSLFQGQAQYPRLTELLNGIKPSGEAHLLERVAAFINTQPRKGVVFLISDFLVSPEILNAAVLKLIWHRYKVQIIHVMAPQEMEFPFRGSLKIRDVESSSWLELSSNHAFTLQYSQAVLEHRQSIQKVTRRLGQAYFFVSSAESSYDFVLQMLRLNSCGRD